MDLVSFHERISTKADKKQKNTPLLLHSSRSTLPLLLTRPCSKPLPQSYLPPTQASPTATARGWVSPEPEALADKSRLSSPIPLTSQLKGSRLPSGSIETPLDPPSPEKKALDLATTPPVTPAKLPTVAVAKYGASVSVGNGKFMPVGSNPNTPVAQKIDFEAEKAKIEAEFTALEDPLRRT